MLDGLSELKRLHKEPGLITNVPYCCKTQEAFLKYVVDYGNLNGVEFKFQDLCFSEDLSYIISGVKQSIDALIFGKDVNFLNTLNLVAGLFIMPVFYPILGGSYFIKNEGQVLSVHSSRYRGINNLIFGSSDSHEMLHAYHFIMNHELSSRGIISRNMYEEQYIEPPIYIRGAPRFSVLKSFERKIIEDMALREFEDSIQ